MKLYLSLLWFRTGMKVYLLLDKYIASLSHVPRIASLCSIIYTIRGLKDWNVFSLWSHQRESMHSSLDCFSSQVVETLCSALCSYYHSWKWEAQKYDRNENQGLFSKYGSNSSPSGKWCFDATRGKIAYNFIMKFACGFALLNSL